MDYKYDYSRKNISKAQVELKFKVEASSIEKAKDKAYTKLAKHVDVKGFRPGKAPRNTVEASLGSRFFEEAINIMLPEVAKDALDQEELIPIAPLQYDLTKYAQGDNLEFKAVVYILPKFDLKKISKIKVKKEDSKVTPNEIEKVIENMFKDWQTKQSGEKSEGLEIAGADKRAEKSPKKDIAKPTDEWAKGLSLDVQNLQELRDKIQIELNVQKQYMVNQKYQYEVLEEAMKLSDAEVPQTTVDHEVEHRMEHFVEDITRLGMTVEKYLEANKTTEEKLKKEWEEEIRKSIMAELIIEQLARANNIQVTDTEVKAEFDKIEDKKTKASYDNAAGKSQIRMALRKNKALRFLFDTVDAEKTKPAKKASKPTKTKKAKK